ncbi:MAG: hypothetical protein ACE5L6_06225 [Candidatus Bathyarchaeia archaeon]
MLSTLIFRLLPPVDFMRYPGDRDDDWEDPDDAEFEEEDAYMQIERGSSLNA